MPIVLSAGARQHTPGNGFRLKSPCQLVAIMVRLVEWDEMNLNAAGAIVRYRQVYSRLYQREPRELRDLGGGWVLVNGARMRVVELEKLTEQMQIEYRQVAAHRRNIVQRLIAWLRES